MLLFPFKNLLYICFILHLVFTVHVLPTNYEYENNQSLTWLFKNHCIQCLLHVNFCMLRKLFSQITKVKIITLCLQPERFVNLGIEPPKGVLLFGPPGTGKTLCARAVANRTDACFIRVIGSELVQKYVGEVS